MNEEPQPLLDPPPDTYADDDTVYRGARSPKWIVGNEVMEGAFYRRIPQPTHQPPITGDPSGLSIATTPEDSIKNLNPPHGVIRIGVGQVRGLNDGRGVQLDVEPDLRLANKGNIKHVPYYNDPASPERSKEAIRIAGRLASLARVHAL